MNEFVIISKDVFEEMVGKFNRFSDPVSYTHLTLPTIRLV